MTSALPLLRLLRALMLALAVLCLLAQPVLSAAHELHDIEHALLDAAADPSAAVDDSAPEPGTLDGLLHAFDCCLHATALAGTALAWTPRVLGTLQPSATPPAVTPSPLSRFLRPPIAA